MFQSCESLAGLPRRLRKLDHLVHLQLVRPAEHLARRTLAAVRGAERVALAPRLEGRLVAPEGHHHVAIALHGLEHDVADEAVLVVDEPLALLETLLEISLVTLGHGNAVGHDNHGRPPFTLLLWGRREPRVRK